jgi:nucleotide-binding universal stress UspA family protein
VLRENPPVVDVFEAGEEDLAEIASRGAGALTRLGWLADGAVVHGRTASVIVEDAAAFGADLIVMGSRGRGPLGSLALGSVSAEVVDEAGRPVLGARRDDPFRRVILADDGSATSARALAAVAGWPVFADAVIGVTSVAHVTAPLHSAVAPTVYWAALEDYRRSVEDARETRDMVLRDASEALWAAGRSVRLLPREGDPAAEILEVAEDQEADLIVLGSRGETGLARLLLGSVARNVLYEAACSVLIVH